MTDFLYSLYLNNYLSAQDISDIQKTCSELKETPVRVIRGLKIMPMEPLRHFMTSTFHLNPLPEKILSTVNAQHKHLIPEKLAEYLNVFAFHEENDTLYLATEDPFDPNIRQHISFFLNKKVHIFVATFSEIQRCLQKIYGITVQTKGVLAFLEHLQNPNSDTVTEAPEWAKTSFKALQKLQKISKHNLQKTERTNNEKSQIIPLSLKDLDTPIETPQEKATVEMPLESLKPFIYSDNTLQSFSFTLNKFLLKVGDLDPGTLALDLLNECLQKFEVHILETKPAVYDITTPQGVFTVSPKNDKMHPDPLVNMTLPVLKNMDP